jgi:HNH endonuclease
MTSTTTLSEGALELLFQYEKNYEMLLHVELPLDTDEKFFIGDRGIRRCRYCGTTDKHSFRKRAHTLPEAVGNKSLISLDECDECNAFFGNTVEDHFSKYLGIHRTLHQIKGKKGVPAYGVPGQAPRLWRSGENQFAATAGLGDNFLEIDISSRKGTIRALKQPYSPRGVFKCLVKIAIAVMPSTELGNFARTIAWLRAHASVEEGKASSYFCFTSKSDMVRAGIDIILLRRKDPAAKLPHMSLFLAFSKFTFQIFIPYSSGDQHFVGEKIQVSPFPNRAEAICAVRYGEMDLSSSELVRDEPDDIDFEIGKPGVIIQSFVDGSIVPI